MRRFYIRRKDLSPFPFQFYVDRNGVEQRLEKGHTFTFSIDPPKDQFAFLHVHILEEFARAVEQRWDIPEADLIRIAAKAFEAWLKGEHIADDHFNGIDMLKVDAAWYPRESDGSPSLATNPYRFEVVTAEPWPSLLEWKPAPTNPESEADAPAETPPATQAAREIVFGFTLDVCPGLLIVGYNQFKHKVAEAGLNAQVSMLSLSDLPCDVDVLFVPPELADKARHAAPHSRIEVLDSFLNHPSYNAVVTELSYAGD